MRMRHLAAACLVMALTACNVTLSAPTPADSTPEFVTATLPATRTPFRTPTNTPTGTPGVSLTAPANCKDTAVLLQDVTIPDGTNVPYGTKFLKTWQFRNTGTCPWVGYKIAFVSGDRMGAADTAPVPDSAPKADVNVSVELTAPTTDGIYTGFFELRNRSNEPVAIGIEKTFWVKITVGNATLPSLQAPTVVVPTISGTLTSQKPPGSCTFTTSWSYPGELVQLINNARRQCGPAGAWRQCATGGRGPGAQHRHGVPQPVEPHRLGRLNHPAASGSGGIPGLGFQRDHLRWVRRLSADRFQLVDERSDAP